VPLDPSYPQQRLETMLQDAQVQVVLTEQALVARLPRRDLSPLCVDGLEEVLSSQPRGNLSSLVDASHLAYVMYTSGSTGQPKGIAVTHGSISNLARQPGYVQITSSDVLLHHSSISFDASTFEVWGSLLNGACLVVAPAEQLSLSLMADLISQYQVSTVFLTASLFHQMVDLHLEDLRPLKYLLAGGEALSASHVHRAVAGLPACQLINGYGPTETTTFACFYPFGTEDQLESSVPIGWPLAHMQAYVLDEHLQPVPVGVEGELYLGGAGLAQGYLNRPDLTAERFLPDPFGLLPGSRLYRTGDRVRAREDGALLFMGRRDGQVKLRGFRIEYAEIEHCLQQHPAIHLATVTLREDRPADKRLVAYLVSAAENRSEEVPEEAVSAEVLRTYLREHLPEYMLPSAFVWLKHLPLNASGKIDRRALPAPVQEEASELREEQQPQTATEQVLAEIWAQVLQVKQVSRLANFFELGGHSLLATRLISRVRTRLHLDLPLRTLFEAQTLARFADTLLQYESVPGRTEAIARLDIQVNAMSTEELEELLRRKRERLEDNGIAGF
ncbi:MAG TPA: non-ribosomal peptide synthetase, partial [Ktedonobacteraceae bacterium]|nr:non-ribosomal peptide synthetase [Ktedonobacteraceae bacterium]